MTTNVYLCPATIRHRPGRGHGMTAPMRAHAVLIGFALLTGCFNPHVKNGGFSCDPTPAPACPSGFYCVNHQCVDTPGGTGDTAADLSAPADLTGMPASSVDMAQGGPTPQPDLSQMAPPPDLAQTNTCAHSICTTGVSLADGCSNCVTKICTVDSYCCNTKWSSQCVAEVATDCNAADHCP